MTYVPPDPFMLTMRQAEVFHDLFEEVRRTGR